ncbi:Zn(2)-C6 fungal-type domain-containing protein [Mycena chlorophos]|uniref:Zn(2)-C6 fungal-type domain-containing protein n=1 Tax=Mycena chlorophos TaxID=658473 RepID=A0A8H6SXT1_MYCCL|nr:Zn(2)-C6 fungal-type domain-containing protein [Mycena chlorophos]
MKKADIPGTGLLYLPTFGPQDEPDIPMPGSKRRRLRGACMECRQRKIRCDRAKRPNNICSNCVAFNSPCTDPKAENAENIPSVEGGASGKTASEHVETILTQSTAYIASQELRGVLLEVARYSRGLEDEIQRYKTQASSSRSPSAALSPLSGTGSSSTDVEPMQSDPSVDALIPDFQDLKMMDGRPRYFGRSSGHYLIRTAEELHQEHNGGTIRQPLVTPGPVPKIFGQRTEYWVCTWERPPPDPPSIYTFPEKDLMDHLMTLYFEQVHILAPFLHRPSFLRDIAAGRHHKEPAFGAVVLGVCALGARQSDDPRVIFPGTNTKLSAGWAWAKQIRFPEQKEHYFNMSLLDLQRAMLTILYMQGTASPSMCWALVAMGVRNLQELGDHRARTLQEPTLENELHKRVFWAFMVADIYTSAFLGRPRATREDDHDLGLPTDCDEEYWEHPDPEKRFKQPSGKPSLTSYWNMSLRLYSVLAKAQATLYSLQRSNLSVEWSQSTVAALDSELNEWLNSVPDHLRWDPQCPDKVFSQQSACLYATYYHGKSKPAESSGLYSRELVQIQIHRNFISSPSNHTPLFSNFPSLTICSNAARAYTSVMASMDQRGFLLGHPQCMASSMDSGLVLLVNVWGAKRSGATADPARAIADLKRCIESLTIYEEHWQMAGRFVDMLRAMSRTLFIEDPPTRAGANTQARKRTREEDDVDQDSSGFKVKRPTSSLRDETPETASSRNTAGSRRAAQQSQSHQHQPHQLPDVGAFTTDSGMNSSMDFGPFSFDLSSLPLSTTELGNSLPEYMNWAGVSLGLSDGSMSAPATNESNPGLAVGTKPFEFGLGGGPGTNINGPDATPFSYADFDFVFKFADSALRMPVAPVPSFNMGMFGGGAGDSNSNSQSDNDSPDAQLGWPDMS